MSFIEEYKKVVSYSGIKVKPEILLTSAVVIAVISVVLAVILGSPLIAVLGIVLADIVAFLPYYIGRKKIDEVEEMLSEALRHMASVIRSGGAFEVAVREIAISDYGQLSKEFMRMLKEMEGGKSFVSTLMNTANRIGSKFLYRVSIIISDALRSGGRVADILDELGEDIRQLYQIKKERKAKTTMQYLFIAASAAVLGPFIVGISLGIISFMMDIGESLKGTGIVTEELLQQKAQYVSLMEQILLGFVIVESLLSAFLAAAMREGRISYGVTIAPVFLLLAYLSFVGGKEIVALLIR